MAETNKDPAAPVKTDGMTGEQLTSLVNAAVGEALKPIAEVMKGLGEAVAALKSAAATTPAADPKAAGEPKGTPKAGDASAALTAADVAKIVADALAEQGKKSQADHAVETARKAAIATHLKGVPDVYHGSLPATADAKELETAAGKVRERYQADLAAAGVKTPNIGAMPGAGASAPGAIIDVEKATTQTLLASNV